MLALGVADDAADVLDGLGDGATDGPFFCGHGSMDRVAPVGGSLTGDDAAFTSECCFTVSPAVILARGEVARADGSVGLMAYQWLVRALGCGRGRLLMAIS